MEFSNVFGALPNFFSWSGLSGSVVIPSLLFTGLLMFACIRTRSTHFLFSRLWWLLNGKRQIKDEQMNAFFETRGALMQFRFLTGLQLRTMLVVHRVIAWSKQEDVEVSEIKACGSHFDAETLAIDKKNLPRPGMLYLRLLAFGFFAFLTIIGTILASANKPLLQFKEGEKRWFFYSKDATVTTLSKHFRFDVEDCKKNRAEIMDRSGWPQEDVQRACDVLQQPIDEKYINSSLSDQRWGFGVLSLYCLIFSWMFWQTFRQGYFARKLSRRLEKNNKRTNGDATVSVSGTP
jgi:hypothetical protein